MSNNTMTSRMAAFLISTACCLQIGCGPATPQVEERVERYETGVVSRRVNLVDGKRDGKMTDYFPDGKLMAERWFKLGKQEGKTTVFYPGGAVKEVQYYHDGAQTAGDTIWYENGHIQFAVLFKESKKNGYLRKWSPEGELIFEAKYAMDTLIEVKGESISRESIKARHEGDTIIKPKAQ